MMFVAAAAMMFAACDKDDDNENGQTSAIVGTWEYHEIQEDVVRDYTETLTFKADGTVTVQFTCYDTYSGGGTWHYGKSMVGPYTTEGSNLRIMLYYNGVMESDDSEFTYDEPDYSEGPAKNFDFTFEIADDILKIDKGDEVIFGHGGGSGVTEYTRK